jgi:hypothetical protein
MRRLTVCLMLVGVMLLMPAASASWVRGGSGPDIDVGFTSYDSGLWGDWGNPDPYVSNGQLVIPFKDGSTRTAGVALDRAFLYGTVVVRLRADTSNFKICALLWPADGDWSWEYDFAEGSDRNEPHQTLHYFNGGHHMIHDSIWVDGDGLADWTTITVEWSPGRLETTINGNSSVMTGWAVPDSPGKLHLQVGRPSGDAESGNLYIDRVQLWD